jgi:effector-binding domain-containing protein
VAEVLSRKGTSRAGPPFARYKRVGEAEFAVEAGFPVQASISGMDEVRASSLPGGTVAVTMHTGPHDEMEAAYEAIYAWIDSQGGTPSGDPWEVGLTDPAEHPDPSDWQTEIVVPYR